MTNTSKGYLKVGFGALVIFAKLAGPKPFFRPWDDAEAIGYNAGILVGIGIAVWLILSGFKDLRK